MPPQAWAFEPDVFAFTYDPARAKQLLDEAGYRDPDGDGPLPRLRLSLKISTNEETRLQSTVIQQDLRRVGIELDVRSYEFATFFADVLGQLPDFSLQWVGGALVDPDILRRVFHSQQVPPAGFNRGYYSNPEVDRLHRRAPTRSPTRTARAAYYGEAQQLIAEDAPYIPIWNRVNVDRRAARALPACTCTPTGDFQALKDVRWRGREC